MKFHTCNMLIYIAITPAWSRRCKAYSLPYSRLIDTLDHSIESNGRFRRPRLANLAAVLGNISASGRIWTSSALDVLKFEIKTGSKFRYGSTASWAAKLQAAWQCANSCGLRQPWQSVSACVSLGSSAILYIWRLNMPISCIRTLYTETERNKYPSSRLAFAM